MTIAMRCGATVGATRRRWSASMLTVLMCSNPARNVLRLRLFLATNAHCGPWHSLEPFFIDVFAAADTFSVLTAVYRLQGFLDESQARETTFVQVVKEISVVADRGQIAFVFCVLDLDFLRGEPPAVYRLGQVLVLARQSLPCVFNLLRVHISGPRVLQSRLVH